MSMIGKIRGVARLIAGLAVSITPTHGSGDVTVAISPAALVNDAEGNPVDVDKTASADGTSTYLARRDHRHFLGAHASSHKNSGSDEVATATPGANEIPKAGAGGTLAAGWIQEVLALADLSDVSAKTGTGTTVVMDTGATLNTPKVGSGGSTITELRFAAAAGVADGGTIAHGMGGAPTVAFVQASVAGEFAEVTALDATNITVAIKKHDGTAGTAQTIYWLVIR